MALLKIARMGHPVLKLPANPVLDPTSPEIAQLVEDMIETMVDAGGTGLAAPQVHMPLRVVVFTVYPERDKAVDLNGKPFEREARGFHARVVQHECDHLDGILYPGRIVDMSTFGFTDEMMRQRDRETDQEDDLSE